MKSCYKTMGPLRHRYAKSPVIVASLPYTQGSVRPELLHEKGFGYFVNSAQTEVLPAGSSGATNRCDAVVTFGLGPVGTWRS